MERQIRPVATPASGGYYLQVEESRSRRKRAPLVFALLLLLSVALTGLSTCSADEDPFGPVSVTTFPSLIIPGLVGVRAEVSVVYPGSGMVNTTSLVTTETDASSGVEYTDGEQASTLFSNVTEEVEATSFVENLENVQFILEVQPPFSSREGRAYVGTVAPGSSATSTFYIDVRDGAPPGEYSLDVVINYYNPISNVTGSARRTVKLFVSEAPAVLTIGEVSATVRSGAISDVEVRMVNMGGTATSVVTRLVPSIDVPVNPVGTEQYVGTIGPDETAVVSLRVQVDRGARGSYPMTLSTTYTDSQGSHDQTNHFTVRIGGEEAGPFVVMSNETSVPVQVLLGEAFPWKFRLHNAGAEAAGRLVLNLETSHPFVPVGNASTLFLGILEPKETTSGVVQFILDENALPGLYTIPFTVEYTDSYGETYTRVGTISVQAVGVPELYIDEITVDPAQPVQGGDALMTVSLVNVGTDVAQDVIVRALGVQGLLGSPTQYVGEIGVKKKATVMFPVHVGGGFEPGDYLQNITVSYRDAYENDSQFFRLFEITVGSRPTLVPSFYVAVGVGVVAVVVFVYLLYRWPGEGPSHGEAKPQAEKTETQFKEGLEPSTSAGPVSVIQEGARASSRGAPQRLAISILLILLYVVLLLPFVYHVNLDNGVVIQSREIGLESLPEHIREICILRGITSPSLLFIDHNSPDWSIMVISPQGFPVGSAVELWDYVVNWRVDWRDFGFTNRLLGGNYVFDRFAVASVRELGSIESAVENLLTTPYGRLLYEVSRANFYGGPVLFTLLITFLLERRVALWNLPAIFALYSFGVWRLNVVMMDHGLYVPLETRYFGYVFIACIPAIIYLWRFERKPLGRKIAEKLRTLSLT